MASGLRNALNQSVLASAVRIGSRGRPGWRSVATWTARIIVAATFIFAWWFVVAVKLVPDFFVSTPSNTWTFLVKYATSDRLWTDTQFTVLETLGGFAIGSIAGILVGLILARMQFLHDVFDPFLNGMNALPRVALAPLFILWFGIGPISKVILAISVVFFIAMINTDAGVKSADRDLLLLAQTMGARERHLFLKIILPGSVPAIFAGLRLGAVYSLLAVVVGEMLSAQHGWGEEITFYSQTFDVGAVFAILLVLALFSLSMNYVMVAVERWLLRWQRAGVSAREARS